MNNSLKLFLIFIFVSSIASAQVKIQNVSLFNPTLNILYVGIDNKLKITGLKDVSRTMITVNNKSFYPSKSNIFLLGMSTKGKSVLRAYDRNKIIFKKEFLIDIIPEPKISLAGFSNTSLSIPQILKYNYLKSELPNCKLKINFPIVSFNMIIISKNQDTINISNKIYSKIIPLQQERIIEKLKSGDKLIFEEIRVNGPDDLFLQPFYIIIK